MPPDTSAWRGVQARNALPLSSAEEYNTTPAMSDTSPVQAKLPAASERAVLPDLVRAVALIGIAIVNVQIFAYPMEISLFGEASAAPADSAAHFAMAWLFAGKFYALFSLMFGASFFFQSRAAERAGRAFPAEQTRRLIGLGLIGLAHALFLFSGDILVTYALLGGLLFTLRGSETKGLVRNAIGFIALNILIILGLAGLFWGLELAKPDLMLSKLADGKEAARAAFAEGGFIDAFIYRASTYAGVLPGVLVSQGASTLGYFCLGLVFAREGWIADPDAKVWRRARTMFLPIGLLIGLPGAWLYMEGGSTLSGLTMLGLALIFIAAPLQALGYAGWLAAASRQPGPIVRFLARAGQASLTAYLLQSVVMSFIFSNWGLGLYEGMTAAPAIATGAATGVASIIFASLWMARFSRGPVEMLFRAWTYRSS